MNRELEFMFVDVSLCLACWSCRLRSFIHWCRRSFTKWVLELGSNLAVQIESFSEMFRFLAEVDWVFWESLDPKVSSECWVGLAQTHPSSFNTNDTVFTELF